MRFRAEQHLRRQLDFQHLRTHGRRHDCGAFVFWYVLQAPESNAPCSRIGFVASRAAVGNAVQRARAKRRLRELFRNHQQLLPRQGYDFMLLARSRLNRLDYREIEEKFIGACKKLFSAHH